MTSGIEPHRGRKESITKNFKSMDKPNYTYKVFLIVFVDAETRIIKEVYRATSNRKAKMYMAIYDKFIYEHGEIDVLGKRYDRSDCILMIKRTGDPDDLPF